MVMVNEIVAMRVPPTARPVAAVATLGIRAEVRGAAGVPVAKPVALVAAAVAEGVAAAPGAAWVPAARASAAETI
jgi:hypothetical protein